MESKTLAQQLADALGTWPPDLEEAERLLAAGADINAADGKSYLYEYLNTYYQRYIMGVDTWDHDDPDPQMSFPEELVQPLEERPSRVADHLAWFLRQGVDLNGGDEWYLPLMLSVGCADEAMTEFLLQKGADPFRYPRENDIRDVNWYFDSLDTCALNETMANDRDDALLGRILRTAAVLGRHGVRGKGWCVSIGDDHAEVRSVQVKF